MPLLRINSGFHRQIFGRDYRGNTIYPDKADTINVCTTNEVETDDGRFSFLVVVKIPKLAVKKTDDADTAALTWLVKHLPDRIANASYWDFFGYTWLEHSGDIDLTGTKPGYAVESDIALSRPLSERIGISIAHVTSIRDAFNAAKQRLDKLASDNAPLGFKLSLNEARRLFSILERVLAASADIGGTSGYDVRAALRHYEELAQRKVESNHNYQYALSSLKRFTYTVHFPECWGQKPEV